MKGINSTFIALIPKIDSPQRLNDFRPISLVGCMYKVWAKVLANKLRIVIGSVVSNVQSTFIKGRQILDGILIANEMVDEAKKHNKELLLFKVDFEKAFDYVDWNYLDVVMTKMNFPILWRKWILECVGTTMTSVLVNGCPTDEFPLERGLRLGYPLSSINGYPVSGVYQIFTTTNQLVERVNMDTIWHKQVPLKVLYFLGASSVTVFQQRIISYDGVLFK